MPETPLTGAIARVAARYAGTGRVSQGYVRGKLRHDPVYRTLIDRGIAESPSLVDVGCGRGILLALVLEMRRDPLRPALHGIEIDPAAVHRARRALGGAATIVEADVAVADVAACDAVTILDVLHYLSPEVQDDLLARVRAVLPAGGRLFVREADAAAGAGFLAVAVGERLRAIARGDGIRSFAYRDASALTSRLAGLGFAVDVAPMGQGTPFANFLWEARVAS